MKVLVSDNLSQRGIDILKHADGIDVDIKIGMSPEELIKRNILRLPSYLNEAINALEKDDLLMDALGSELARSYLAIRRADWDLFSSKDEEFELKHHFYKY